MFDTRCSKKVLVESNEGFTEANLKHQGLIVKRAVFCGNLALLYSDRCPTLLMVGPPYRSDFGLTKKRHFIVQPVPQAVKSYSLEILISCFNITF